MITSTLDLGPVALNSLALNIVGLATWVALLLRSAKDPRAGTGARHRNAGLPRMRRSGTTPRRRADRTAAPEHTLAA